VIVTHARLTHLIQKFECIPWSFGYNEQATGQSVIRATENGTISEIAASAVFGTITACPGANLLDCFPVNLA
jgi:hypothetical protein